MTPDCAADVGHVLWKVPVLRGGLVGLCGGCWGCWETTGCWVEILLCTVEGCSEPPQQSGDGRHSEARRQENVKAGSLWARWAEDMGGRWSASLKTNGWDLIASIGSGSGLFFCSTSTRLSTINVVLHSYRRSCAEPSSCGSVLLPSLMLMFLKSAVKYTENKYPSSNSLLNSWLPC